ncbi:MULTISPECIES: DUF2948 family protein [Hyphomonas]|jgi:hypothetical protein|uniref:DUF2948 domain-containing protein n=1 Tax=Hyphomonas adhaerens MHS-3 TaxID=1280949 RepID=A0A069E723_9PROT|nr:DUF2948 family protein [Hyphomonas adhaerens]KCZ85913.1 hypothetical protein HAD_09510 [Hyphomonas adhaerens MHS-3]
MSELKPLRLLAEEAEDLEIISAAVQDSVVKAENLNYEARIRRFSLEINRYRWEEGVTKRRDGERVRSLLAFDGVLGVKTRAVTKADPELILSLLQVTFTPDEEPPGGKITLLFAGDGEIELTVEALDATLLDSDYIWNTRHTPSHERRKR